MAERTMNFVNAIRSVLFRLGCLDRPTLNTSCTTNLPEIKGDIIRILGTVMNTRNRMSACKSCSPDLLIYQNAAGLANLPKTFFLAHIAQYRVK